MSPTEQDLNGRLFDIWPDKYDRWFETPIGALVETAIHFQKADDPKRAVTTELDGQRRNFNTGAFLAGRWEKPKT